MACVHASRKSAVILNEMNSHYVALQVDMHPFPYMPEFYLLVDAHIKWHEIRFISSTLATHTYTVA